MNVDLRIARARRRLHDTINVKADYAAFCVKFDADILRGNLDDAFATAARSLGQLRRYRNAKGDT